VQALTEAFFKIFACALTAANITTVKLGGLGKHGWDITYVEAELGIKVSLSLGFASSWLTIVQLLIPIMLLYVTAIFFVKISIIFFVQRLAGPNYRRGLRYTINGFFVFHIAFLVGCVLGWSFQCTPVSAGFSLSLRLHPDTHCKDYEVFYWVTSGIHAISDIAMLALPVWMVAGLPMSWQKKAAVIFMFGLGGLACVCSLVRMAYIGRWADSNEISCTLPRLKSVPLWVV
jgi:hypothetical protein